MQRLIVPAAILLLLQLGIVIYITLQDKDFEPYAPNTTVVSLAPSAAGVIQISADEGILKLVKEEGSWLLSAVEKVPADSELVESFLEKIAGFKRSLAVATSEDAAKRFRVSHDEYAYHLVISGENKELANLYFGTSPGFKQIHLREAGRDEIITVGLGSHELSPAVEQWIDKNVLKLGTDTVQRIEFNNNVIERNEDATWNVRKSDDFPDPKKEQIDELLDKMCNLSVNGFVAAAENTKNSQEPELMFSLLLEGGKKLEWKLIPAGENDFVVIRSDLGYALKVSKWQVDDIKQIITDNFSIAAEKPVSENTQG